MSLPLPPPGVETIAFFGTPDIAVPTLHTLIDAGFSIPIVVSGPDRRRGRGGTTSPSPVKRASLDLGLEVTTEIDDALHVGAELGVVVAFGKIIPTRVLEQLPMVNLHVSALPRWRGAAPNERAILAGDPTTAISIMAVVERLDEGDIWAQETVEIGENETTAELRVRLGEQGANLMARTIREGFPASVPQSGDPVYATKLTNEDVHLDWNRPAAELQRVVRVGGAWTTFRGDRFKIWEVEMVGEGPAPGHLEYGLVGCGEGALRLVSVQPAGKPRMSVSNWSNGAQPSSGELLGDPADG